MPQVRAKSALEDRVSELEGEAATLRRKLSKATAATEREQFNTSMAQEDLDNATSHNKLLKQVRAGRVLHLLVLRATTAYGLCIGLTSLCHRLHPRLIRPQTVPQGEPATRGRRRHSTD